MVLDEIETPVPEPIEVRFHTDGTIAEHGRGRWTYREGGNALDVAITQDASASIESPSGWIRPGRVLRLSAPAASRHAFVTVLQPLPAGRTEPARVVTARQAVDTLVITVGADRVTFVKGTDGWRPRSQFDARRIAGRTERAQVTERAGIQHRESCRPGGVGRSGDRVAT